MTTEANLITELSIKTTNSFLIDEEFSKNILDNIFFKNINGLRMNSDLITFNSDLWEQNPKQFCLDYYKSSDFYKIILLVNDIPSIFSFKRNNFKDFKIYAPIENDIFKLLSLKK
jgi:hypothetical protein